MSTRTRYALIGTGSRAAMYLRAMAGDHRADAELVAWLEVNPGRLDHYDGELAEWGLPRPQRVAEVEDFAALGVERVVVTSPDHTHAEMISRALRAGADVVVEKPITIDLEGIEQIAAAIAETGREVITTFNYRYSPRNTALRQVIADGSIGRVTSVHFEWVLDTMHGADYFRRWHRYKDRSGGLLVHKSSHHFDLVNWWLADRPTRVYASGGLRFYGADAAAERGLPGPRAERGTGAAESGRVHDRFHLDLRDNPQLKALYLDNEHHDGYLRDRDVFDPGITIEDNLSLVVDYAGGPSMSYSLNAHAPWEGYRVAVNGTEGRAELEVVERGSTAGAGAHVDPSAVAVEEQFDLRPVGERLLVQRHWEDAREVEIVNGEGGHGGGDRLLLADLFSRRRPEQDPLRRPALFADGVAAIGVGIAGNASLRSGRAEMVPTVPGGASD